MLLLMYLFAEEFLKEDISDEINSNGDGYACLFATTRVRERAPSTSG